MTDNYQASDAAANVEESLIRNEENEQRRTLSDADERPSKCSCFYTPAFHYFIRNLFTMGYLIFLWM